MGVSHVWIEIFIHIISFYIYFFRNFTMSPSSFLLLSHFLILVYAFICCRYLSFWVVGVLYLKGIQLDIYIILRFFLWLTNKIQGFLLGPYKIFSVYYPPWSRWSILSYNIDVINFIRHHKRVANSLSNCLPVLYLGLLYP